MAYSTIRYGWTLQYDDWSKLTAELSERKWARVPLEAVYQDSVPSRAGIYLICGTPRGPDQRPFRDLYGVLYAGQANSLRRRFCEHCQRPKRELAAAHACMRSGLDYWYCSAASGELNRLEGALIRALGPPANLIDAPKITARIGQPVPANAA
jgi:hypothetical protein